MQKRKGARSIKEIPQEILNQLNNGELETANLVEWLATDQKCLLKNFLEANNRIEYLNPILQNIQNLKKQTVNTINYAIGKGLLELSLNNKDSQLLTITSEHTSDIIRGWATYMIGINEELTISEKLNKIQKLAADKHFGVREISWMAVRPSIAKHLTESLDILTKWAKSTDESIRRFASEATRPRGVWCEHIQTLKENPALGLPILEPLKADTSRYVQNSVGNWLNDASKTQPEFVKNICKQWLQESNTKETEYIIKKAMRTIDKANLKKKTKKN